jgi:hypothetical protein
MSAIPDPNETEPPLWSIGIVVAIILIAPLVLYSLAPTGPLREGDTVFSAGQQRVRIETTTTEKPNGMGDTCLLDPDSPLIVIHAPHSDADRSIIAEVQGNPADEWPFCPVHAEVRVKHDQIFQKPAVFENVRELLAGFLNR